MYIIEIYCDFQCPVVSLQDEDNDDDDDVEDDEEEEEEDLEDECSSLF